MRAFAELLDRLSLTASRNAKLVLLRDYLRATPDPDRGWALAALTGDLTFDAAKPAMIRKAVEARVDPVLFGWSWDYVGDMAETVSLIWPGNNVHCSVCLLRHSPSIRRVPRGQTQRPSSVRIWPGSSLHSSTGGGGGGNGGGSPPTVLHCPLRKVVPSGQTQRPASFMTKPGEHSCTLSAMVKAWQAKGCVPGRPVVSGAVDIIRSAVATGMSGGTTKLSSGE